MTKYINKKWVWFDLDDTLHDFSGAARLATNLVLDMLVKQAGLPADQIESNYKKMLASHNQLAFSDGRSSHEYREERFAASIQGSTLSFDRRCELVGAALGQYEHIYIGNLKAKEGAAEILNALKAKGYELAILSDAPHDAQSRVISALGFDCFFNQVFTSGKLGTSKQNGMFSIVLDRLSAKREAITMVGDSLERDIAPALASNFQAIWFNERKIPNQFGCQEIHSLKQLPDLLEQINGGYKDE